MNVYIGGAKDYSAMRGPCPSGFHIPLGSECEAMYNMGISLGAWTSSTPSNIKTYLKLPAAGDRSRTTGNVEGQGGTTGVYWSASVNSSDLILTFGFDSSNVYYNLGQYRSLGRPIRAFKDTPVVPDNTWTTLKSGTGSAGIYWSSALGLISISSNGTTWITLADKNLGATQVYNDGDTQTEANCGKYYQRGNNYGFPFTGSVTTSSTKVNAGTYGPGNYYSSSTFITVNSGTPNSWDSSNNKNLRGGVTGIVSPAELKNAYIGEYVPPYLCFTANTANSTVTLYKNGTPTSVTLETSTDGSNWNTYTMKSTITLSNIGDKVYFRNTSETDTGFNVDASNFYQFLMGGSIAGSGDITSLLNKNGTTTLSNNCFYYLFLDCTSLTTTPKLYATTLADFCYTYMFRGCTSLLTLPNLPATTLVRYCYFGMFYYCSNIKLSTTQTGTYQTPYRIPTTGTGTTGSNSLSYMFDGTGGTFTGTPSINTTYYTSNTVV